MTGFVAVLAASLLGSLHCMAMCGGFAALATSGPPGRALPRLLAYHGARVIGYLGLGAVAGTLGAALDDAGVLTLGVPRAAAWLMGALLVGMGLASLTGFRRNRPVTLGTGPGPGTRLRRRLAPVLRGRGVSAAAAIGGLSALLPCGWLWGYLAIAASTATVAGGLWTMVAFWLGTVPALLLVGVASRHLAARLGRHAPRLTGLAMIAVGLVALTGKLQMFPESASDTPAPCHEAP